MIRLLSILLLLTATARGAEDFRFVWVSDVHVGRTGTADLTNNFAYIKTNLNPAFILATGDLADDGSYSNEIGFHFVTNAAAPIPTFAIPGNHDECPGQNNTDPCIGTVYGDYDAAFPDGRHFVFITNSLAFIGFTSTYIRTGALSGFATVYPDEVTWVRQQLTNQASKTVILMAHHPLNDNWGANIKGQAQLDIYNAITNHGNVKLYLSGHRHLHSQSETINGTVHISGPGLAYSETSVGAIFAHGAFIYGAVSNSIIHTEMIAGNDPIYTRLGTNINVSYAITSGISRGSGKLRGAGRIK